MVKTLTMLFPLRYRSFPRLSSNSIYEVYTKYTAVSHACVNIHTILFAATFVLCACPEHVVIVKPLEMRT